MYCFGRAFSITFGALKGGIICAPTDASNPNIQSTDVRNVTFGVPDGLQSWDLAWK